jgi:DNA-binding NarL/FixJ family response regulator
MKPTRVLLAEDHTLVRAGIRALLQNLTGVQVVGEASDGREALRLIKTYQPDVVLMDIAMAGLNGLEATARVTKEFPTVRVIILSMHSTEEYVAQALRAGAAGYLLKDAAATELELAVTAVARGETYLSPAV